MPYPIIRLTRPIRRAIMFFGIAVFLIATPALILYAAGYRYDWQEKQLKQTGVMSIDITPADAAVSVNNIVIKKKPPIRLPNRAPGSYTVKIEKEGYHAWEKQITVESRQTAYIKDISLFKTSRPKKILPDVVALDQILPSKDGGYMLILSRDKSVETIALFSAETKTSQPLLRYAVPEKSSMAWSPFTETAIIMRKKNAEVIITLVSSASPDRAKTYTYRDTAFPAHILWHRDLPVAFVQIGKTIHRLSLIDDRLVFETAENTLWHVDADSNIWTLEPGSRRIQNRNGAEFIGLSETMGGALMEIIDINRDRVILRSDNGIIVVKRDDGEIKILPTISISPHINGEWITWSPWEIWSIYRDGNVDAQNRLGERIVAVAALENTGTLLIATKKSLLAFNPGYVVTQELFSGEIELSSVNRNLQTIYFLGKTEGERGLFELEY